MSLKILFITQEPILKIHLRRLFSLPPPFASPSPHDLPLIVPRFMSTIGSITADHSRRHQETNNPSPYPRSLTGTRETATTNSNKMAPREDTSLLPKNDDERSHLEYKSHPSDFEDIGDITLSSSVNRHIHPLLQNVAIIIVSAIVVISMQSIIKRTQVKSGHLIPTGPYRLVEAQYGSNFFDFYDFYDGPDSYGSAGYNVYVSKESAMQSKIAGVKNEYGEEFVYMSSASTEDGPRDSVRLEGKRRFDRGLFVLDVVHMPNGPGVWPAFWLTDEAAWPRNGEVDILEGINGMTTAKTALHTSNECDMYAHVSPYDMTGDWEWISKSWCHYEFIFGCWN